jgi:hypothetical protein
VERPFVMEEEEEHPIEEVEEESELVPPTVGKG